MIRTVMNRRTVGRTFMKVAVMGTVVVLGYGGIRWIGGALDRREAQQHAEYAERDLQSRVAVVEQAITAKNLPQAEAAFQALDAANVLPPEREAALRVTLEQAVQQHRQEEVLEPFTAALSNYNLSAAAEALTVVEQSGLYAPAKITEFRGEISALRDEGTVYRQLLAKTLTDRKGMITYYLSQFPDGAHAPEVRTVLFIDRLEGIIATLQRGEAFSQVLTECDELTAIAERYSANGVTLPASYSPRLLEDAITAYGPAEEVTPQTPKGALLSVRRAPQNLNLKWNQGYIAERDATIPIGSIGKNLGLLTDTDGSVQWLVQFDSVGRGAWQKRWDPISNYWRDDHNDVAGYRKEELETMRSLSPTERFAADRAFQKLRTTMRPYFAAEAPQ